MPEALCTKPRPRTAIRFGELLLEPKPKSVFEVYTGQRGNLKVEIQQDPVGAWIGFVVWVGHGLLKTRDCASKEEAVKALLRLTQEYKKELVGLLDGK